MSALGVLLSVSVLVRSSFFVNACASGIDQVIPLCIKFSGSFDLSSR